LQGAKETSDSAHRLADTCKDPELDQYNVLLSITDKGRLYLEYIWLRLDLLYYFALDTPLSKKLLDDGNYVLQARDLDKFEALADFFEAAIPTVATLLRHIIHFDRIEREDAFQRLGKLAPKLEQVFDPNELARVIGDFEIRPLWEVNLRNTVRIALRRDQSKSFDSNPERAKVSAAAVKKTREAIDAVLRELDLANEQTA
jgi:hypothetical protein